MSNALPPVATAPVLPKAVVAAKPSGVSSAAAAVAAARGIPAPPAPAKAPTRPEAPPAAPVAPAATVAPLALAPLALAPLALAPSAPAPSAPAPVAPATEPTRPAAAAPHYWQAFFLDWPSQIPKRGIVISQQNEASPFKGYMVRGDFVLFERTSPDALGGRYVVLPCQEIASVKFTDPLKQDALEAAGFVGALSQ